jgi:hypothetical protein
MAQSGNSVEATEKAKSKSSAPIKIEVNGNPFLWYGDIIHYEEIRALAGYLAVEFPTVKWSGPAGTVGGLMSPKRTVKISEGMRFSVVVTGNA